MKTLALTLVTLVSTSAFAIGNSNLDKRHQAAIKKAVIEQCSFRQGTFEEVKTDSTPIRVDQGILDYDYVTVLKAVDRVDQGVFDDYIVTVKSHYSDSYDHEARDWGHYYVSSVKCELQ